MVTQLAHSLSDDKNLVPFHFWQRETVLKREKVYKGFAEDRLKIFRLVFASLKMRGNSKNDQLYVGKRETFSKILSSCNWNGF